MMLPNHFRVFGWYCTREIGHTGPCAAKPRWWNILDRWRYR